MYLKRTIGILSVTLALFASLYSFFSVVSAQTINYTPLSGITDANGTPVAVTGFTSYLTQIYKIGVGLVFTFAFLSFLYAGWQYVGSDLITSKADAKTRMTRSLIGVGLALTSYVLLNTINPDILAFKDLNITLPTVTGDSTFLENLFNTAAGNDSTAKSADDIVSTLQAHDATVPPLPTDSPTATPKQGVFVSRDGLNNLGAESDISNYFSSSDPEPKDSQLLRIQETAIHVPNLTNGKQSENSLYTESLWDTAKSTAVVAAGGVVGAGAIDVYNNLYPSQQTYNVNSTAGLQTQMENVGRSCTANNIPAASCSLSMDVSLVYRPQVTFDTSGNPVQPPDKTVTKTIIVKVKPQ